MIRNRHSITLGLALALAQCKSMTPKAEPAPAPAMTPASAPAMDPPRPEATAPSVYELDLTLTDQDGRTSGLDVFAGRPVIISMFYGTCPYACPMLIADIKKVLAGLDEADKKQVGILLVSFDPDRDNVSALKELARAHKVDSANWRFTRAPSSDVRELAAVLGIKYRVLENGAIDHSTVITVLDSRGAVRRRSEDLGKPDAALTEELRRLAGRTAGG